MNRAYEEITDWLAGGFSPADLVAYRPSEAVRERVADLIRRSKNEVISAAEQEELAHYLQLEHSSRLAKAKARYSMVVFGLFILISGVMSCATAHKYPSCDTTAYGLGNNNVITETITNSTFKGNGQDKLIIKGSNNLLTYYITNSDIVSYNTKTVTIIEGNNNNFTSTIRKCVLIYKNRTDTVIIKGDKLKINFKAENIKQLIVGSSQKATPKPQSVSKNAPAAERSSEAVARNEKVDPVKNTNLGNTVKESPINIVLTKPNNPQFTSRLSVDTTEKDFDWSTTEGITKLTGFETVYVTSLGKDLSLLAAVAYYTKQAQQEDYEACYQLGLLYDSQDFAVITDLPRAIQYYERAARHNHAKAAFRLGQVYEFGDFELGQVIANRAKAKYYYSLAAQNGSAEAKDKLANWQN